MSDDGKPPKNGHIPEIKYEALFENTNDAIFMVDLEGHHFSVNKQASKMLGYNQEELIHLSVWDVVAEREKGKAESVLRALLKGEQIPPYERVFRKADGSEFPVELNVTLVRDSEGNPEYVQSIVRDISRRQEILDALRISEERFRSIFETAAFGMIIADVDLNIVDANMRFQEIVGYTIEELKEMRIEDITHPDDMVPDRSLLQEVKAGNRDSYQMEKRYIKKDGSIVLCNLTVSAIRNEQGNVILTTGMIEDISKRKQSEEELRKLSRAIEHSPASVVITDAHGDIEYVNPAFSILTYYSSDEVLGKNPRILKTDLTPVETHEELWDTITSGKNWNGVFANKKKNGEIYWEDAFISPIFDNDDRITHYVAVKIDITKQRETQEQLKVTNDELELYTSFLQHDLRNDLQLLMSNAEAGLIVGDEKNPLNNYLEVIKAASERMKRVLDVFSYPSEIHNADFQNLIKEIAEQAEHTHINLKIQVRNLGMPKEFRIPRARLLPIVFDNLFRNSARFGGDRVSVVVELSQVDHQVQVDVSDDGPGVSEEIRSKIFRKGVSTTGGGSGLYLTKKLIEGYNGSISYIETDSGGAKFRILFPLL